MRLGVDSLVKSMARILVRHIEPTDVDTMRWVGDRSSLSCEQCAELVVVTQRNYALRGYSTSALVARHSGKVIGFCGLVHPGGQADVEIKYALRRDF